ncbi:lipase [Besnoitia besnoiti]|uniref:Lipase n=1 Tax=Besnoitia besnoiti TaxID=94643 RepID=A0A2A9MAU4_BESBE|nr:lipase [Besnoitia besnoiti]PFH35598.1 lipase [Besnoitia besnoiti]
MKGLHRQVDQGFLAAFGRFLFRLVPIFVVLIAFACSPCCKPSLLAELAAVTSAAAADAGAGVGRLPEVTVPHKPKGHALERETHQPATENDMSKEERKQENVSPAEGGPPARALHHGGGLLGWVRGLFPRAADTDAPLMQKRENEIAPAVSEEKDAAENIFQGTSVRVAHSDEKGRGSGEDGGHAEEVIPPQDDQMDAAKHKMDADDRSDETVFATDVDETTHSTESGPMSESSQDVWLQWLFGDAEEEGREETLTLDERPGDPSDWVEVESESSGSDTAPRALQKETHELTKALGDEENVTGAANRATEAAARDTLSQEDFGGEEDKTLEQVPSWVGEWPSESPSPRSGTTSSRKGFRGTSERPEGTSSERIPGSEGRHTTEGSSRETNTSRDHTPVLQWVPASKSMAPSWWGATEADSASSPFLADVHSKSISISGTELPLEVDNVAEYHDMRKFGVIRVANTAAFRHQAACGGFFTTALLLKDLPSMYGLVCTLVRLSSFAEQAAKGLHIHIRSPAVKALAKLSATANARKHAIEVALAMRRYLGDVAARQDSINLGVLLNKVMMEKPRLRPVCVALMATLMECRASLPYTLRKENGFPVLPLEQIPTFAALEHLNEVGAHISFPADAPKVFEIRIVPPSGESPFEQVDGAQRLPQNEPWRHPIYQAFSTLWYFCENMYRIGERYDDVYKHRIIDDIFPSPWRVTYLGIGVWTEWLPFHDAQSKISRAGLEVMEKYKLRAVSKRVPYTLTKQLFVEETPDTPRRETGVLSPFNVDKCERDATYAGAEESPFVVLLERRPDAPKREAPAGEGPAMTFHDADAVWVFKGTDGVKQWTLNTMLQAVPDKVFSERGLLHQGFATHFHQTVRRPFTRFLSKAAKEARNRSPAKPYVVAVTGHSLGGALALLGSWFLAKNLRPLIDSGRLVIYSVVFGSPTIGDVIATKEMNASGAKIFKLQVDLDPVPFVGQTDGVTKLYRDTASDIQLHVNDMAGVALWNADKSLKYSGLVWLQDSVQPYRNRKRFLRFFTRPLSLSNYLRTHNLPFNTHLHFIPCALTIITGRFDENGWESSCAAPLLKRYPLLPNVLSAELQAELKRVHEEDLPKITKRLEAALKSKKWLEARQKLIEEGKFAGDR